MLAWLKHPKLLQSPRWRNTEIQTMMSGNDWWNRNVFSCRRKEETDGADHTSSGRVFQKMEAATGNERRPPVDRLYWRMCSCSVNDDRRRR